MFTCKPLSSSRCAASGSKNPFLSKRCARSRYSCFPRYAVKVGQHFAHSAVLHQKHALHLLFAQRVGPTPHPARHLLHGVQRLLVAGQRVHVEMARHHFVDGIERSPNVNPVAQSVK